MSPKFYWTTVARSAFAALGRRGKASLPDLMADLGMHGKSAQSSLVQALARWARRGLVAIDTAAHHRAPRYMLTQSGHALWNGAVRAAQARASAFYLIPAPPAPSAVPASPVALAPAPRRERSRDEIYCPACSERYGLKELLDIRQQHGRVMCAGCQGNLGEVLRRAEAMQDDLG